MKPDQPATGRLTGSRNQDDDAFTLIELLVGIAIIPIPRKCQARAAYQRPLTNSSVPPTVHMAGREREACLGTSQLLFEFLPGDVNHQCATPDPFEIGLQGLPEIREPGSRQTFRAVFVDGCESREYLHARLWGGYEPPTDRPPSDFLASRLGVVSFADNHVESHKWLDARIRKTYSGGNYIGHNDSVGGSTDIAWIANRTPLRK